MSQSCCVVGVFAKNETYQCFIGPVYTPVFRTTIPQELFHQTRAKASGSTDFFAGLPLPLAFGKASQREAPAPHKRNDHRYFQAFQNTVYTYFKVFQSSKKVVKNLLPAIVGACLPQNHRTPSITYFSLKDSKNQILCIF